MKCPNCNETLLMAERHTVEIDYCPNCRGVWLDKGELDKLLQYSADQNSGSSSRSSQQTYSSQSRSQSHDYGYRDKDKYGHQHPHKKKSFLSDFFDFD